MYIKTRLKKVAFMKNNDIESIELAINVLVIKVGPTKQFFQTKNLKHYDGSGGNVLSTTQKKRSLN